MKFVYKKVLNMLEHERVCVYVCMYVCVRVCVYV